MKVLLSAALILLVQGAFLNAQEPARELKKIIVAVPSISVSNTPAVIAKELGYYRREGFNAEIVLMKAGVSVQALVAGSVDYTGTPGATMAAAVQGVGLRVLMAYSDRPLYDLIVRPEITSYGDLRGKIFGVGSFSGLSFEIPQVMLSKNHINPKRDVTMILVGPTETRLTALRTNAIQATILEPPYNFIAIKEGFRKLDYSGTYSQTLQGALTVSANRIKTQPEEVGRFVKATLRGLLAYRDQKETALSVMKRFLRIEDPGLVAQIYDYHRATLTADGTISEELMRTIIDSLRESGKVGRAVPSEEVFNFSFVRAAMNELTRK
ncbi:MAG: ABC transporter substrate-binding protein [Deltaproteobacteria bacterium]|nr:ABC transporter substrate-binding protein [Deltaproteobacteria bacterium]